MSDNLTTIMNQDYFKLVTTLYYCDINVTALQFLYGL